MGVGVGGVGFRAWVLGCRAGDIGFRVWVNIKTSGTLASGVSIRHLGLKAQSP